jgi:microtubule-associated protein-like 6
VAWVAWVATGLAGGRDQSQVAGIVTIKSPYENTTPPFIRSLDLFKDSNVFIAGTHRCDIWEVDDTPEVLIYGHQADVWGLATNPVR